MRNQVGSVAMGCLWGYYHVDMILKLCSYNYAYAYVMVRNVEGNMNEMNVV